MPGIGKTTVAKTVGFFLEEREKYSDGIIFVTMNKKFQANMLISQLYYFIKKNALKELGEILRDNKKRKEQNAEGNTKRDSKDKMEKEIICEDVEEENTLNQNDLDNIIAILQSKQILLILDNIEDPLHNDESNFKAVLEQILNKCGQVKMLMTSRAFLKQIGNTEEIQHKIEPFNPHQSVRIFFAKARQDISTEEIQQLLQKDYPKQLNKSSFKGLERNDYYRLLQEHPFFLKFFSGHPHAISLIAPMTRDYQLVKLYELVSTRSFMESSQNESHQLNSLKLSLQTSVSYILEKKPKAVTLFSLIGQMPGGVTKECLIEIWGADWYYYIPDLMEAQLVHLKTEDNQDTYKLLPFMHYFSNLVIEVEELQDMHITICKYFVKIMKNIFVKIGVEKERDNFEEFRQILINHETNIWAALDRIKDYNLKKQAEILQQQFEQNRETDGEDKRQMTTTRDASDNQKSQTIEEPLQRQTSRIDKFDYILTLQNKLEISKQTSLQKVSDKIEKPKLLRQRSNSVSQFVTNQLIKMIKQDTKSQKSFKSEEDDIVQIGAKANNQLTIKKKIIKDLNSTEMFQLYESDTSFANFEIGKNQNLQKPQNAKDNFYPIVPSSKLADYLSDNDDASLFLSKSHLPYGKAKTMNQGVKFKAKQQSPDPKHLTDQKRKEIEDENQAQIDCFNDLTLHMNFDSTQLNPEQLALKRDSQISRQWLMSSNQNDNVLKNRSNSDNIKNVKEVKEEIKAEETKQVETKLEQLKPEELEKPKQDKPKVSFQDVDKKKEENQDKKLESKLKKPTQLQTSINESKVNNQKLPQEHKNTYNSQTRQKCKQISVLDLPVEGRLIMYYASNLILENNLDLAINVLSQYGLKYNFEGERGICQKANVQKLLAVAFFKHNRNFTKIEGLLNSAKQKFKQLNIFHGLAVISLAKAQFYYQKSYEFVDFTRSEDDIVKLALKEVELSSIYFNALKNKMGENYCIQLRSHILQKLGKAESNEQQRKNAQVIKEKIREFKEMEKKGKIKYIYRNACKWISLIIEPSYRRFENYSKTKLEKAHTNPNIELIYNNQEQDSKTKQNLQQQNQLLNQKKKENQTKKISKSLKQSIKLRQSLKKTPSIFKEDQKESPGALNSKNIELTNQSLAAKLSVLKKSMIPKKQESKNKDSIQSGNDHSELISGSTQKQSGVDTNDLGKAKPPKTHKRFSYSSDSRQPHIILNPQQKQIKDNKKQLLMSENTSDEHLTKIMELVRKTTIQNKAQQQIAQNQGPQNQMAGLEIMSDFDFSEISRIDNNDQAFGFRKQPSQSQVEFSDSQSQMSAQHLLNHELDSQSSNTDLMFSMQNSSMDSENILFKRIHTKVSPQRQRRQKIQMAVKDDQISSYSLSNQIEETSNKSESGEFTQIESSTSFEEQNLSSHKKSELNFYHLSPSDEEEQNLDLHFIEEAEVIEAKKLSKMACQNQDQSFNSQKSSFELYTSLKKQLNHPFDNQIIIPSANHLVEETLEVDKNNLTPEQKEMITTLYDMYINLTNEAERQNLRGQINQYLLKEKIAYKTQKETKVQLSADPLQVAALKHKIRAPVIQQLLQNDFPLNNRLPSYQQKKSSNQKMNLLMAKNLGRKQAYEKTKFYQPKEPEIKEDVNESSSSEEEPVIAKNIVKPDKKKEEKLPSKTEQNQSLATLKQARRMSFKKPVVSKQLPEDKTEFSRLSVIKNVESKIKGFIQSFGKQTAPQEEEHKKSMLKQKPVIAFGSKAVNRPSTANNRQSECHKKSN